MTKKDPEEKRRKRERKQARSAALGFDGGEMAGTPEIANPNTAVLRRSRSALLLGAVAGAILIGLASYALLTRNIQATRDAYVAGNVVPVTAQEAGTVIAIGADDTQAVKAGDTLVTLDSTLANVRMSAAEAELASALRQVGNAPRQGHGRAGKLGRAKHRRAKATAANAARDPAVLAAIADIRQSAIIQAHLRIVAPVDGVVALRTVQIDEQLSAGTPLMAVVPLRSVWVVANFRQAQLANLRIGQPVRVKSDIWGSAVTFHGRVAGLSAGSGLGSLSQRSGGGWFKPEERLPVRIVLDPHEVDAHPLRIGLSVAASIDTSEHSGSPLAAAPATPMVEQPSEAISPAVERHIAAIIAANTSRH